MVLCSSVLVEDVKTMVLYAPVASGAPQTVVFALSVNRECAVHKAKEGTEMVDVRPSPKQAFRPGPKAHEDARN